MTPDMMHAEIVARLYAEIDRLQAIPKCDPNNCTFGNRKWAEDRVEIERLRVELRTNIEARWRFQGHHGPIRRDR